MAAKGQEVFGNFSSVSFVIYTSRQHKLELARWPRRQRKWRRRCVWKHFSNFFFNIYFKFTTTGVETVEEAMEEVEEAVEEAELRAPFWPSWEHLFGSTTCANSSVKLDGI